MKKRIEDKVIQEKFYFVMVECRNCGFTEHTSIPKGWTVSDTSCVNCKCKTLSRINPLQRPYYAK